MTTDPIGELIEAAKESETDRSALVMLRLHNAIAAVEQMRRETKRPEVVGSDKTILGIVCPYIHDDFYACRGDGSCLNDSLTMAAGKIALDKDLHLQEKP